MVHYTLTRPCVLIRGCGSLGADPAEAGHVHACEQTIVCLHIMRTPLIDSAKRNYAILQTCMRTHCLLIVRGPR